MNHGLDVARECAWTVRTDDAEVFDDHKAVIVGGMEHDNRLSEYTQTGEQFSEEYFKWIRSPRHPRASS